MSTKQKVYVIGHKNPDTDSIAASIAYTNLKNHIGNHDYEARRCGNISAETQYVLDRFEVKAPKFVGDVRTQVRDMEINKLPGVDGNMSLKAAWRKMKENQVVTLCVTEGKKLKGIITTGDIMESYMGSQDSTILAKAKTSYKNIVETLSGEMITGDPEDYMNEGKVIIAAGTPDLMEAYIEKGDVVILGDRYEMQLCAIECEASCVIISAGAKVTNTIQKIAAEHNCKIIVTPHTTFTIARLITQALPISFLMKSDKLMTFKLDDYIEDIQPIMASTRHRYFPVIDSNGAYRGMVSRRNFIGARKKQMILVDHNEKSQAVNGIENADILEIIDHHRLGTISTSKPVFFRNQPLGSTCTIIYLMYQEFGIEIDKQIAGIMLSAILSDTLLYRSPTCTELDKKAGEVLSKIAGVKPEELATEMFRAGSNLNNKTPEEIIHQDYKKFTAGDKILGIGQISSMDELELEHIREVVMPVLEETRKKDEVDMLYLMLTNIMKESSTVIFAGKNAENVIENGFMTTSKDHESVSLNGVVSRKKQMVPTLVNAISQES